MIKKHRTIDCLQYLIIYLCVTGIYTTMFKKKQLEQ